LRNYSPGHLLPKGRGDHKPSSAAAQTDAKRAEAERGQVTADLAAQTLTTLRQAVANGYQDAAHMKGDNDLDALRPRGDFKKLRAELEAKGKAVAK
jgi:hypothetical protein